MSLANTALLRNLALGQALLIAPALGESYEAKSAGTISALLLMIAADLEQEAATAQALAASLSSLLLEAKAAHSSLAADLAPPLAQADRLPAAARLDRMLEALVRLHVFADDHDPALAARCRAFLADWAAARVIRPPDPPAAPSASA